MKFKSKHLLMGVAALLFIIALFLAVSLVAGLISDFAFGSMLYEVYGFSSFLIPVFFFVAAFFCVDDKWSLQRIVCLAISFIPFFTLAIAENVARKVYVEDIGPIAITKIIILMAIAVLLVAMEYLVAMVLSTSSLKKDLLPQVLKYKKIIVEKIQFYTARFTKKSSVVVPSFENEKEQSSDEQEVSAQVVDEQPLDEVDDAEKIENEEVVEKSEEEMEIEKQLERNINAAVDSMFEENEEEPNDFVNEHGFIENSTEYAAQEGYLSASDYAEEDDYSEEVEPEVSEPVNKQETMELPSVKDVFEQMESDVNDEMQESELEAESENLDTEEEFIEETEEDTSDIEADAGVEDNDDSVIADLDDASEYEEAEEENSTDETSDEYEIIDDEVSEEVTEDTDEVYTDNSDGLEDEETEGDEVSYADMPRAVQSDGTPVPLPEKKRNRGPYSVSTDLLTAYEDNHYWVIDEETEQASVSLTETLNEFGIKAEVTGIIKGPVITMFEMLPAPGVKLSKIVALQDNIALRLAASSVRIVAPIPGKNAVGIEIPNADRAIVSFKECIEQDLPEWKKMAVPVILGKDIQGNSQIMDLVKTPHLLIAGSTGAGKSVCVNSMLMSILYKRSPDQVKLILIDPKIVELKLYNDIPHLLTPVITEPKKAMQALQYCLCEMERRYALLDGMGVRDISSYNKRIVDRRIAAEKLPYLIVVIDEFADLMATTGKQLETVVARLCAMSRAVGIHLVLATQRPSIDVITGLIKANIPSRIAFMVASKTDSRIIIDQVGAEKLLGKGDMLYASSTDPFPIRIQGTFVSDQEVENVVECVKQWGEPEYIDDEIFVPDDDDESDGQISLMGDGGEDPLYEKALDIVVQAGKASASYIQRRLKIGYNRAARLVEEMEERGIVGPANGSKPREIIHIP